MDKENKKEEMRKYGEKVFLLVVFVMTLANITVIFNYMTFPPKDYFGKIFMFLISDVTAIFAAYFVFIYKQTAEADKRFSEYQEYLQIEISKTDDKNEKDILQLMLDNNKEIAEYFKISKGQEKASYGISIACSVAGVVMLAISIGAVFFNGRIETTIIAVVGGAITELVSGIVLWIHNKSAMQLNYYYDSLHENEKFLAAVKTADRIGNGEMKDNVYAEIVRAQVNAKPKNNAEKE